MDNLIRFELCKDKKKIIKMGSDPKVFWKINGVPWKPGARVHIGYYNYIGYYKDRPLGVLQLDKFSDAACIIHGWIFPQYCKPVVLEVAGREIVRLFKGFSCFEKVIATCPSSALHAIRWLKKIGFEKEAVIKDASYYRQELVDCVLMTYRLNV